MRRPLSDFHREVREVGERDYQLVFKAFDWARLPDLPDLPVIRSGLIPILVAISATALPAQGRGPAIDPIVPDDRAGFEAIFDGTSLKGWEGDPAFWKAENGAIVGETTQQNPLKENTFLIWRGGEPKNFELKLQFRLNAGNSGVQIRSAHVAPGTQTDDQKVGGKWVLKGYQADIDFENRWTGQLYEERGRGFLATRGLATQVPAGAKPRVIANLQQAPDALKALIKINDWNQLHLIARGNTIFQILNGAVTSIVVDDDAKNRAAGGLIGFQVHTGPPMKVEFRNIWLKNLD